MFQKAELETILKINGASSQSPDEEIRSVLLSSRYNKDEIETAIMVLREDPKTHETKVDGMHKVFRTDQELNSAEISSLLGIDVAIDEITASRARAQEMNTPQIIAVIVFAIAFGVIGIGFAMYYYEVGMFHPVAIGFGW